MIKPSKKKIDLAKDTKLQGFIWKRVILDKSEGN